MKIASGLFCRPFSTGVTRASMLLFLALAGPSSAQRDRTSLVHPLVGTANAGQTFPAAGVPFAMTYWTPQTRAGEVKCIAPYYFADEKIQGFRGTHFISGSCVPDYGSFTLAAGVGPLKTSAAERSSRFERSGEHAAPYAYSVELGDAGVRAEITGTLRAGYMRFTATRDGDAWVVIENNARAGEGFVRVDPATQEVSGEVPVRREYAGSGKPAGFSGHFVVLCRRRFAGAGTWVGTRSSEGKLLQQGDGLAARVNKVNGALSNPGQGALTAPKLDVSGDRPGFGVYLRFPGVHRGETIELRIGTSFVSADEARKNLQAEIPAWNFDQVEAAARQKWTAALGQIQLGAPSSADTIFYTALYHSLLHPRLFSDADGSYPRFASTGRTEHAVGFDYYDDFSMWDIYRAQLPLLSLLQPRREVEMMRSLIVKGEQGGFLPIFPAWNSYTSEMTGDHAAVAIIDAYRKGIRGFDIETAYRLIRHNAMENPATREEYVDGKGRRALTSYMKDGFIPLEDPVADSFHQNEQVSRTLDYAFDDHMIGLLAGDLGHKEDGRLFLQRGTNWRNVIDPGTGFARGRHQDGSWLSPFHPEDHYTWITESLPWETTFFVPHDVAGLITLEGGNQAFVKKLDELFAGGYYEHGNEPSHHIAYLYDAAGAASRTQERVRTLMDEKYKDGPDGLSGNDDAGQMSAWYVMSAMGIYQVAPGIPEYWLGSPRFDQVTIALPNGKHLQIVAQGAGGGLKHVDRVLLNGVPLPGYKVSHQQLAAGGRLEFVMRP